MFQTVPSIQRLVNLGIRNNLFLEVRVDRHSILDDLECNCGDCDICLRHFLAGKHARKTDTPRVIDSGFPRVLHVSRQIRKEALPMFYSLNWFRLICDCNKNIAKAWIDVAGFHARHLQRVSLWRGSAVVVFKILRGPLRLEVRAYDYDDEETIREEFYHSTSYEVGKVFFGKERKIDGSYIATSVKMFAEFGVPGDS